MINVEKEASCPDKWQISDRHLIYKYTFIDSRVLPVCFWCNFIHRSAVLAVIFRSQNKQTAKFTDISW